MDFTWVYNNSRQSWNLKSEKAQAIYKQDKPDRANSHTIVIPIKSMMMMRLISFIRTYGVFLRKV